MSDTPRTDAAYFKPHTTMYDLAGEMQLIELELNWANERINRLIAERDTARRQADQNWKLREEFTDLLGTDDVERGVAVVREMKERIKRLEEDLNELRSDEARLLNSNGELERRIKLLEEAGDLMVQHFYTDEPRSEMWEKAKEAKP